MAAVVVAVFGWKVSASEHVKTTEGGRTAGSYSVSWRDIWRLCTWLSGVIKQWVSTLTMFSSLKTLYRASSVTCIRTTYSESALHCTCCTTLSGVVTLYYSNFENN